MASVRTASVRTAIEETRRCRSTAARSAPRCSSSSSTRRRRRSTLRRSRSASLCDGLITDVTNSPYVLIRETLPPNWIMGSSSAGDLRQFDFGDGMAGVAFQLYKREPARFDIAFRQREAFAGLRPRNAAAKAATTETPMNAGSTRFMFRLLFKCSGAMSLVVLQVAMSQPCET